MGTGHTKTEKGISEEGFVGTALLPSPNDLPLLPAPSRAAQGILTATRSHCWAHPAAEQGAGEGTHSAGPTTLSQTRRLALAPGEIPNIPHLRVDVLCSASEEM